MVLHTITYYQILHDNPGGTLNVTGIHGGVHISIIFKLRLEEKLHPVKDQVIQKSAKRILFQIGASVKSEYI